MNKSTFTYVTYIRTTPKKLWLALTTPKTIEKYWFGIRFDGNWKTGTNWRYFYGDEIMDSGKILKAIPQKFISRSWKNEWRPDLKSEGISHSTYELKKMGSCVQLTVTHTMNRPNSKFIKEVSAGWPMCMSNLKSLLETGKVALTKHPGHTE
jgi:uncharacterized protein YndB with AHSA1/START domain